MAPLSPCSHNSIKNHHQQCDVLQPYVGLFFIAFFLSLLKNSNFFYLKKSMLPLFPTRFETWDSNSAYIFFCIFMFVCWFFITSTSLDKSSQDWEKTITRWWYHRSKKRSYSRVEYVESKNKLRSIKDQRQRKESVKVIKLISVSLRRLIILYCIVSLWGGLLAS